LKTLVHIKEAYIDDHEARYIFMERVKECEEIRELNNRELAELKYKIEMKLKTVMSLKKIEEKNTYCEGLEIVN
jgi:hypothetical protein